MMDSGRITLLVLVGLLAMVNAIPFWKSCGGNNVLDVKVNGCTTGPCVLPKGKNSSFEIKYTAGMNSNTSKSVVHGIVGIPIPFPLADNNGCHYTTPGCPIVKDTDYTFKTVMPVKSSYPSITLVVKWEEVADNNQDLVCILIMAKLE